MKLSLLLASGTAGALALLACSMTAETRVGTEGAVDAPPEFGRVAWLRDHDAAFERAREAEKPVFLLFQEVPG